VSSWAENVPDEQSPESLFVYLDVDGSTWQLTEAAAATRPGLVRLDDDPMPVRAQRVQPTRTFDGVPAARQVGDAAMGEGRPATS
jgi:hypothetical protein